MPALNARDEPERERDPSQQERLPQPLLDSAYACEDCHDLGYVRRFVGPQPWQTEVLRCPCQLDSTLRERWQRARAASVLAPLLYTRSFEGYELSGAWAPNAEAVMHLRQWCQAPAGWVVLWGGAGTGKTHLLAASFNAALSAGSYPLYVLVPSLLAHLKAGFETGDHDRRFADVCGVGVLLLDDLGAEQRTPWTDETVFRLLDYRYVRELPTVVATNCVPADLEVRIASRLSDLGVSTIFRMVGPDYRPSRQPGTRG